MVSNSNVSLIEFQANNDWNEFEEAQEIQIEIAETAAEEAKEELGKKFYRYGQNNKNCKNKVTYYHAGGNQNLLT